MKYHRTPIEVDAVCMAADFVVGEQEGRAGDYLVTFEDGRQVVFDVGSFSSMFALGSYDEPVSIANKFIRRHVAPDKVIPFTGTPEDAEREENQTSEAACFTCGEDVRVSQMDALRNCPACASNYVLKPANVEVVKPAAIPAAAGPQIVLCNTCGAPGPAERMNASGCFRCDPELMVQAMAQIGG
jgi:predicted Zn-ribbon and HTH transcriptional regulator